VEDVREEVAKFGEVLSVVIPRPEEVGGEGGREGGREGGKEGRREGGLEGGREGVGREGGREGRKERKAFKRCTGRWVCPLAFVVSLIRPPVLPPALLPALRPSPPRGGEDFCRVRRVFPDQSRRAVVARTSVCRAHCAGREGGREGGRGEGGVLLNGVRGPWFLLIYFYLASKASFYDEEKFKRQELA
jgi:hypothetical protein